MILADNRRIAINLESKPFSVVFENLRLKLQGPILDLPSYDVILGLDWLKRNNPRFDWPTSTLTIKQEGINYQIYPDTVDNLLKDYIFVKMMEVSEEKKRKKGKKGPYDLAAGPYRDFAKVAHPGRPGRLGILPASLFPISVFPYVPLAFSPPRSRCYSLCGKEKRRGYKGRVPECTRYFPRNYFIITN